jgi:hypothetical protein
MWRKAKRLWSVLKMGFLFALFDWFDGYQFRNWVIFGNFDAMFEAWDNARQRWRERKNKDN